MRDPRLTQTGRARAVISARELVSMGKVVSQLARSGNRQGIRDSTGVHQRPSQAATGSSAVPFEIGPSTHQGPEAPDTSTWDRNNQPAGFDGVSMKFQMRTVYAASEIIYGYYRELTFDSSGGLVLIPIETRYIINTPDACP